MVNSSKFVYVGPIACFDDAFRAEVDLEIQVDFDESGHLGGRLDGERALFVDDSLRFEPFL